MEGTLVTNLGIQGKNAEAKMKRMEEFLQWFNHRCKGPWLTNDQFIRVYEKI